MPEANKVVAGVAWFRADQWQLLRSLSVDADTLERTHAEWEAIAEKRLLDLAHQGLTVRKVDVDVDDLVTWCRLKQRPLNGAARAAYALALLQDENKRA